MEYQQDYKTMKKTRLFLKSINGKLREKSGETLVETLVSMLIVVLAVTMLAGSIVAAARVNAGADDHTIYLNERDTLGIHDMPYQVSFDGTKTEAKVKSYTKTTDDGTESGSGKLFYYE